MFFFLLDLDSLRLEKSDALQNHRLSSFYNLTKNQEKEKAFLIQTADKATRIQDFVKVRRLFLYLKLFILVYCNDIQHVKDEY